VLRVTFRTLVGQALAAHAGPVVVLDGTGNAGRLGAELGAMFREVAAVARERATVHRRVLAIPRATRTNWCPGGVPRWGDRQATLSGTLRALVERIRKDAPAGCAVALATFRPVALALAEAWKALLEHPDGSAVLTEGPAALLAPLLGHVAELRLTHTGASDTRGANTHADCAGSASLGDWYPNLGDARDGGRRRYRRGRPGRGACRSSARAVALHHHRGASRVQRTALKPRSIVRGDRLPGSVPVAGLTGALAGEDLESVFIRECRSSDPAELHRVHQGPEERGEHVYTREPVITRRGDAPLCTCRARGALPGCQSR
jgi:hypothetical protein